MGGACCVAARETTLPSRTTNEAFHRNVRYSPSWSFRWDNRGRVAGEVEEDPPHQYCNGISGNIGFEIKSRNNMEVDVSDGGTPLEQTNKWRKSSINDGTAGNLTTPVSDLSKCSSFSMEVKDSSETSMIVNPSERKLSLSTPSASSVSTSKADPVFPQSCPHPADFTFSKRPHQSEGHKLLRGASDSRILSSKSPNNSISEGRQSFVLSANCSNDVQVGSSDGWSMRTFSELVASSQRERWSFDSEIFDFGHGKVTRSNSQLSTSPSEEPHICVLCSKLVTERSSWTANELAVVAVLVCGHLYHADCLEKITPEADKYDPSCPVCMAGEKQALKISARGWRVEVDFKAKHSRISRNRVVDSDLDGNMALSDHCKSSSIGTEGKGPKMGSSSSMKSSFTKPFLRRHFSLGSKSTRSLSINEPPSSAKRKSFWGRYRKE